MPGTMASIEASFRSEGRVQIARTLQQGHVQSLAKTMSSTSLLEDSLTKNSLEDNRAGAI